MRLQDGYKMTELGEIPVDWEVKKLGQLGLWYGGGTPSKANSEYWDNGEIGWVTSQDVKQKFITATTSKITEIAVKESSSKMTTPFSLLMVMRSGILKHTFPVAIAVQPVAINQDIKVLSPFENVLHEYVYQYLQLMNKDIVSNLVKAGTTVQSVEYDQLKKYLIPLPSLPEQQKIADILSTVDDHISETESLIEKTKVLKQGMMQRLLTKGIGHTEFKDTEIGRIPVEWEVIPLGKHIKNVSRKNKDCLVTDVVSVTKHNGIVDSMSYFKNQVYSDNLTTYKIVRKGEFAFPPIHLNEGSIGYLEHLEQAVLSPMYTVFSVNQSFFDNYFLFRLLKSHKYINIYSTFIEGTVERRGAVSFDKFSSIKIPLPPLIEQKEITSILTSIDDQIDSYQTKLTALTKLKSALMQQLLTGQTRVKV